MQNMRVLLGEVGEDFEDVAALPADEQARILAPDAYAAGQAGGRDARRGRGGSPIPASGTPPEPASAPSVHGPSACPVRSGI